MQKRFPIDSTAGREEQKAIVMQRIKPIDMNPAFRPKNFDVGDPLSKIPALGGTSKFESDEIRGALRFFLGQELASPPEFSLSIPIYNQLIPHIKCLVYWRELDELRRQVKMCAFTVASTRLTWALRAWQHPQEACFALRQIIEATWWSLYCTYGAQIALAQMTRMLTNERAQEIYSKDIEDYLRGWFAPDAERIQAGLRAVRSDSTYVQPESYVEENAAVIDKQRAVARFLANSYDAGHATHLTRELDVLMDAYHYLCGWVHMTPLLVLGCLSQHDELDQAPPLCSLIRVVATAAWKLQKQFLFGAEWNDQSYHGVALRALDPQSKRTLMLRIEALEELRHQRKPVEVTLDDGTILAPYPKKK